MRELGNGSIVRKKVKPQTSKTNHKPMYENILNRGFEASRPMEKLVSDIAYVHTKEHGWCYLATVLDLYSKSIVGWSFSKNMTVELTIDALEKVIDRGFDLEGTILHSDRGAQYTAKDYRSLAKAHDLRLSYSDEGCPYDNAPMESFNAVLKKELVHHENDDNFTQAKRSLFQYIDGYYNTQRTHGSINYLTPYERLWEKENSLAS